MMVAYTHAKNNNFFFSEIQVCTDLSTRVRLFISIAQASNNEVFREFPLESSVDIPLQNQWPHSQLRTDTSDCVIFCPQIRIHSHQDKV